MSANAMSVGARSVRALLAVLALAVVGCTGESPSPPSQSTPAPATSPTIATAWPTADVTGATRPTVSWQAVPGAVEYRIAVAQPSGHSWAWSGAETQVVLGGGTQDGEGLGFRLTGEATLFVAAVDASGTVLEFTRYTVPAPG